MSTGYGAGRYGISQYGVGDDDLDAIGTGVVASLLVQPTRALPGGRVTVSGVGVDIVDTSRDDTFDGPGLSGIKWSTLVSGLTTHTVSGGLTVALNKSATPSSFIVYTATDFISCDVSVDYQIQTDVKISPITSQITYAALEYHVDATRKIIVGRRLVPGYNGHQIYVSYINYNREFGRAVVSTNRVSGRLRIIKHGSTIAAMHDDDLLFEDRSAFVETGRIRMVVDSGGQDIYIRTKFNNFTSNTGVIFASRVMTSDSIQIRDKIDGIAPPSDTHGPVDVFAFNHNGMVGQGLAAFEYPLVTGVPLSDQGGMTSTVQSDPVLR